MHSISGSLARLSDCGLCHTAAPRKHWRPLPTPQCFAEIGIIKRAGEAFGLRLSDAGGPTMVPITASYIITRIGRALGQPSVRGAVIHSAAPPTGPPLSHVAPAGSRRARRCRLETG